MGDIVKDFSLVDCLCIVLDDAHFVILLPPLGKPLINGHWFAGISGWYEPDLIHDVVHNRTVNLRGGLGHNIAMDRVCEFLNAEFKGAVNCSFYTVS